MFKRLLQTTNDPVFTIIRLVLGLVFFAHGAQKMLGWFGGYGFSGTLSAFSTSGMPTPLALFVILTEFFGSVAPDLRSLCPSGERRHRIVDGGRHCHGARSLWLLH